MSWRIITIQNPACVFLKNKQLILRQEKKEVSIPIEDVCTIVLDSPQINITSSLLAFMQTHNIVIIICDNKHIPNGIVHSFHQHSKQTQVSLLQRDIGLPLQKRLWQRIIQRKIKNQSLCLRLFKKAEELLLIDFISKVESGDKNNIEAQAARIYWQSLFDNNFKRQ